MGRRPAAADNMQTVAALTYLNGGPGERCAKRLCLRGPIGTVWQQATVEVEKPERVSFREDEAHTVGAAELGRRCNGRRVVRPEGGVVRGYHTARTEVARVLVLLTWPGPAWLGDVDDKLPICSHCRQGWWKCSHGQLTKVDNALRLRLSSTFCAQLSPAASPCAMTLNSSATMAARMTERRKLVMVPKWSDTRLATQPASLATASRVSLAQPQVQMQP